MLSLKSSLSFSLLFFHLSLLFLFFSCCHTHSLLHWDRPPDWQKGVRWRFHGKGRYSKRAIGKRVGGELGKHVCRVLLPAVMGSLNLISLSLSISFSLLLSRYLSLSISLSHKEVKGSPRGRMETCMRARVHYTQHTYTQPLCSTVHAKITQSRQKLAFRHAHRLPCTLPVTHKHTTLETYAQTLTESYSHTFPFVIHSARAKKCICIYVH